MQGNIISCFLIRLNVVYFKAGKLWWRKYVNPVIQTIYYAFYVMSLYRAQHTFIVPSSGLVPLCPMHRSLLANSLLLPSFIAKFWHPSSDLPSSMSEKQVHARWWLQVSLKRQDERSRFSKPELRIICYNSMSDFEPHITC